MNRTKTKSRNKKGGTYGIFSYRNSLSILRRKNKSIKNKRRKNKSIKKKNKTRTKKKKNN